MIAVIDNYDSFTYNLVQYLGELGAEPVVFRNDRVSLQDLDNLRPSHMVISPGPGTPERNAGISNEAIKHLHERVPILGVCLGHQCIAHAFGGRVVRSPRLMHGKVSRIIHEGGKLFAGIPTNFEATRYHSLIVEAPLPEGLRITARTPEGELMALEHCEAPTYGLQFHPESILTPYGKRILRNFLALGNDQATSETIERGEELSLPQALELVLARQHLSESQAEAVMNHIMSGEATPAQIGAFLAALRAKGETVAEITGFARSMRRHATHVEANRFPLVDTCGTGGDGAQTFNISTTAAFVVAGAGVAVAKHGNRSVSSRSGSADVLMALGVNLDLTPEQVARCIDEVGFGFLYAPLLQPAMKHAAGPRREMGIRTVFNALGPLTNPAGASCQIIGVYDESLVAPLAEALARLGSDRAYILRSADGLDELSTAGPNRVVGVVDGQVRPMVIDPQDLGLPRIATEALRGGDAGENAAITRAILQGEQGARRDVVLLNAALALMAAGVASSLASGLAMAAESIDSGHALAVLDSLVRFTQAVKA